MGQGPLQNGNTVLLSNNPGTLPYVGDTFLDYFQQLTFEQITKTVVNFQVVETKTVITFQGVLQAYTPKDLILKSEGQWAWNWYRLHCDPTVILDVDDCIIDPQDSVQYRVMHRIFWRDYGYIEYAMIQDYQGSGP